MILIRILVLVLLSLRCGALAMSKKQLHQAACVNAARASEDQAQYANHKRHLVGL